MRKVNCKLSYQELKILVQSTEQLAEKENNPIAKTVICDLNHKLNQYAQNYQHLNYSNELKGNKKCQ